MSYKDYFTKVCSQKIDSWQNDKYKTKSRTRKKILSTKIGAVWEVMRECGIYPASDTLNQTKLEDNINNG